MYDLIDNYCWTKEKKRITKDIHNVPGLGNFSHYNYLTSSAPSPMHYHSNIIEIHCMIKGQRYTQIEKDGKLTKYVTTGNQALLTFPFEVHSNGTEPMTPFEYYALQIITSDPYNLLGLNREYSFALYNQLINSKTRHFALGTTHMSHLRSAFNFFQELKPASIINGVQFLTCFLFNLRFLPPIEEIQTMQIDSRIKKSIDYLSDNITEELQLIDLAKASGYSLSRFKVKFKEEIGITPAEYINLQKFEIAKKQLVDTNINITDLAFSLGFSSVSYFCSVFKKFATCSPQQYRKRYGTSKITT